MDYISALFGQLCARTAVDINLALIGKLLVAPALKAHFIDAKDGRVDFWRLMKLFPAAAKLQIHIQKGLCLDAFVCDKFLKVIDLWGKLRNEREMPLNVVILSSSKHNRRFKQQTKTHMA